MDVAANATPTKRFFVEMITRDISMEDAILDLIDNSIDSFIRTRGINLRAANLLETDAPVLTGKNGMPILGRVTVELSPKRFRIEDNTGGITRKKAQEEVFRFGAPGDRDHPSLGVYGIGLKRAIFKLGQNIKITSRTPDEGFEIRLDAKAWEKLDDWTIPIKFIDGAGSLAESGTVIEITELYPNVRTRINDGTAERRLHKHIAETYPYFLNRMVTVELNEVPIPPTEIPLGRSEDVTPAVMLDRQNGVDVRLVSGLADRSKGDWNIDRAGWYILCNGRVVVSADKTELTGWGAGGPQFVSKYRGFVGLAFFFADDPVELPWTTTKRGINRESPVFIKARNQMHLSARPVLSFLNSLYPSDAAPEPTRRAITEHVRQADIKQVISHESTFTVRYNRPPERMTTKIQYDALNTDIERIRKCLRKSRMTAKAIGEHTFQYFLDMECSE